jgi:hypothetical protein
MRAAETNHVVIADIRMPFLSRVLFVVKAAIAAVPAFIIPGIPGTPATEIFGGLGSNSALA